MSNPTKRYLMIYCTYNPDYYMGHKVKRFDAVDMDDAEKQGHLFLNGMTGKGKWEYQITEIASDSSYRIYDNLKEVRL